ncbi:tRNA dihydrouridine synthase DusB [Candidatus Woesearchaeota archaeon]|jgi:tRNA-dihydrouridine synthase B|nr:tRNA dihydrouridine synthase DusB [Candidatus Woesearchaeota archaeon]MBT5272880.1 tRNA dihydrouridine synthase DusB [Candidatus Woesearchaeota archaeon]MBT6041346.1 tRNA dihydrouridine synthase DusB [Candidatus Woesearchaeota archaeon]MBT6337229.1 tRNA dihydrouridine synthase DusB [Candidatus Woesearchaeota archaeon]MBT7927106.1 tRNA dihydrouridine synthase DusB [Candidatus Woesearchaeota archaeon]
MTLKIGKVKLENPFILAPLHGVNCMAFRLLCKEYGAGLVYSSMIHVNWLVKEKKLPEAIEFCKEEKPIAVQLIGNDPKTIKEAVEIVEPYADIIDFNFGCPDGDVLGWKMGAYLVKHPDKIPKILGAAIGATNKPVTAKIRSGWDEKSINCVEVGKMIEDSGAEAVALHARTKKQVYAGKADWTLIKKLKDAVNIPVIGNGDVTNGFLGKSMLDKTGCDFVMIGRGAMGYPFVFKECNDFLERGKEYRPSMQERHDATIRLMDLYKNKQNKYRFGELKQHIMWSWKWLKGAKEFRVKLMQTKDENELLELVNEYFKTH